MSKRGHAEACHSDSDLDWKESDPPPESRMLGNEMRRCENRKLAKAAQNYPLGAGILGQAEAKNQSRLTG